VVCLLIGYPLALALSREGPRLQAAALLLIMLPMWMNFLLRTYAWMNILDNNGLLNRFLGLLGIGPLQLINTQGAVVLGMVYNYLPFMILPVFTVVSKIHVSLVEAAQDLGGGARVVFFRVTLPLSLPGVLSGVTMVFVPSVSTFIISRLLGGGKVLMLGDLIEMQFLGVVYNLHLGSAISIVMMLIVFACMAVMHLFGEREDVVFA
jgi:spermidine/putrescine transport system permease protein